LNLVQIDFVVSEENFVDSLEAEIDGRATSLQIEGRIYTRRI
jgi:hypothetical protein